MESDGALKGRLSACAGSLAVLCAQRGCAAAKLLSEVRDVLWAKG